MKCPQCNGDSFKIIANPNCKCPDGDGGFSYTVGESAYLPCPHSPHGECTNCVFDVGAWNTFIASIIITGGETKPNKGRAKLWEYVKSGDKIVKKCL